MTTTDVDRPRQSYLIFDQSQRVIHASSSLRMVLGLSDELSVEGQDVTALLALAARPEQETLDILKQWVRQSPAQPAGLASTEAFSPLVLLTAADARTVHGSLDFIGQEYRIAAFEDVTAKLDVESGTIFRDHLTGVGNRALLEYKLDEALARVATGEAETATVLFLDLDRFKLVNDTLGHAVGDALLRLVSERLQSSLRASDLLARLGGDEFAILLPSKSGKEAASTLAMRIVDLVQRPYLIDGQVINVGVSMGIAAAPVDGRSRDQLLKSADLALYYSKAAGRGVFNFFQPAMEEKALQRRALEQDLRKALVLRQFELHYQPQIDVETQRITGLEALLRWRHPQRGLMLPGSFLALAEELGLAVSIGSWTLKVACKEAIRWPDAVVIAVNISSLQFETGQFATLVKQALTAANLPGYRLEIEVTEDILLRDGPTVLATLTALRALGVRVAIDNFGTGLASLSQLVNFPFDKIKIDRSLTNVHENDVKHRAVVRAISTLGQTLGVTTLAEGVETADHLAQVRAQGCQSVQGFYYSKAVPANELAELFASLSTTLDSRQLTTNG